MIVTIILGSIVQGVTGQGNLNVAFRPSFNFPTKDLGETELKQGGGFETTFSYRFISEFAAYAGWGWNTFNPKESTTVAHFEETGYRFGIQHIRALSEKSKLNFAFSAGIVMNHIETENDDGDIIDDSGHGIGWEIEVGLGIPLNERWQIEPDIRYHALSRNISDGGIERSVDLNYLSVGVAVCWTLIQ